MFTGNYNFTISLFPQSIKTTNSPKINTFYNCLVLKQIFTSTQKQEKHFETLCILKFTFITFSPFLSPLYRLRNSNSYFPPGRGSQAPTNYSKCKKTNYNWNFKRTGIFWELHNMINLLQNETMDVYFGKQTR